MNYRSRNHAFLLTKVFIIDMRLIFGDGCSLSNGFKNAFSLVDK
jgi:hypothetical protein